MSIEPSLVAVVKPLCPLFFWDVADEGAVAPYVVAISTGGQSLRALDGSPANIRNTAMRLTVWARTRKEATELSRQIEDALCVAAVFRASPMGEPVSLGDPVTELRGSAQTFSIWGPRS